MDISRLTEQHREIEEIVQDILQLAKPAAPTLEAGGKARARLVDLSGKVGVHLITEDKVLYPSLLAAKDPAVVAATKRFVDEMGGIAEAFKQYLRDWPTGATIHSQSEKFRSDTEKLFSALAGRIRREESELYKLAEKT